METQSGVRGAACETSKDTAAKTASGWLEAEQALWGAGYLSPGEPAFGAEAAATLALSKDMDVAVFGAGLCGAARDIGAATDSRIIAYEWDETLETAAVRVNAQFKSGFHVKLQPLTLSGAMALGKRFDALICHDRLHALKNRIAILSNLGRAVKAGGSLLLSDFVAGEEPMDENQRARCFPAQNQMPWPLWSASAMQATLTEAGFQVARIDNLSPSYRKHTLASFTKMKSIVLQVMAGKPSETGKPVGAPLTAAVRTWAARHDAMKAGTLQVRRFMAIKQMGEGSGLAAPWIP